MKKTGENFDVAMGSFDGAEICELVGLFLLDRLASVLGKKKCRPLPRRWVGCESETIRAQQWNAPGRKSLECSKPEASTLHPSVI